MSNWASTLRLPKSKFPPRSTQKARAVYLQRCADDFYQWQRANRPESRPFILHDGPPYANGSLHLGHAMNKILKDMIVRRNVQLGRRVTYIPGWDCHGLPIELRALRESSKLDLSPLEIRRTARALATRTIEEQTAGFRSYGVAGDWSRRWTTMDAAYEVAQLRVFRRMVQRGLIYRRFKPVYWSPASRTALAEAELEYRDDHVSTAAYVKFPVEPASASALLRAAGLAGDGDSERLYALIWTTTPWTLPANRAVAVHSQLDYHVVRLGADLLLMAATRYDAVRQACFPDMTSEILATVPGTALLALRYQNPLLASSGPLSPTAYQPVIHAQFVSADTGTGLVHLAPGHGFEDHQACEEHGVPGTLDPPPIDDEGRFTRDAYAADPERLANRDEIPSVIDGHGAAEAVLRILRDPSHGGGAGLVLHSHRYTHRYPYDWRAGKPVIVRATAQWFADAGGVSESALRALDDVSFVPVAGGRARLEAFVRGRSAWCISRQRAWGVPIPALMDRDTGEAVVDDNTVHHLIQTVERRGTDAWWSDDADDPAWIPQRLRVEGPQQQYVRSMDTMDVWFDSGTSWTHHGVDSSGSPVQADVYLEGSDQHRGWFQSSLLTWVAAAADASSEQSRRPVTAPFRTLITHGFTLDGEGRKMSKSLGNVVSPNQIMDGSLVSAASQLSASKQQQSSSKKKKANTQEAGFGPDALRLWVASSDYTRDVAVSSTALANVHAALIKHRNTIKMLLGCLDTWRSPTTSSTAPVTDALEASEVQGSRDDCSSHNTPARPPSPPALTRRLEHVALLQLRAVMAEVGAHYDAFDFARGVAALNRWIATDLSALYLDAAKDWLYCGTKLQREQALVVVRQMLEGLLRMLAPVTPLVVEEAWEFMPEWIKDDWSRGDPHPLHQLYAAPLPLTLALDDSPTALLKSMADSATGSMTTSTTTLPRADLQQILVDLPVLSKLHAAVRSAMERARQGGDKTSGTGFLTSSTQTDVVVRLPSSREAASLVAMLRRWGEQELEDMWVVARVRVVVDDMPAVSTENVENPVDVDGRDSPVSTEPFDTGKDGITGVVEVRRTDMGKCSRCWRHVLDEKTPKQDDICGRCAEAVAETQA